MLHLKSAIFYGLMSTIMVFSNKYLFSAWNFKSPIFLILIQMFTNITLIMWLNRSNFLIDTKIETSISKLFDIKQNTSKFKLQLLIGLFYSLHSVLSLKALSGLNIPIYIVFKRCTTLINLIISVFVFKNFDTKKPNSKKIVTSILCMTLGVLVAGIGDINFDFDSYMYCGFSVVCQAIYLSTIQKYGESSKTDSSLQSFYECSVISIPLLTIFFGFADESKTFLNDFKNMDNLEYLSVFALVIISGSLLCFSQFWCTINNNAITTSVLGVLKSMAQTLIGIVLFQSWESISTLTYFGILINFIFGTWYTYLKFVDKELEAKQKILDSSTSSENNDV